MRLFVDIENKKLVQGLNSERLASAPSFMQGDNEPLEIHLLATGTSSIFEDKVLNTNKDFLRVGIARFKGEPKLLSIISKYTPLENGGAMVNLPLNTVEIETALGNNASLDAFLEIEYSTSEGRIITVLQTSCKLKNDLIEDAPSTEIADEYLNKAQIEGIYLKKSDNLESIEDKTEARKNIEVYSCKELDDMLEQKSDASSFGDFLKQYNTKNYFEDKGAYKGTFYLEEKLSYSFTYMFTYIKGHIGDTASSPIEVFGSRYYYGNDRLAINPSTNKFSIYKDANSYGPSVPENYDYDFNAQICSGDKISVVCDAKTFNLKIYVNKDLACELDIGHSWEPWLFQLSCGDCFIDAKLFKDALYSSGNSGYSVSKYVDAAIVPSLCYSKYEATPEYNFPPEFTGVSKLPFEAGVKFEGVENCLKIYPSSKLEFQTANIDDVFNGKFVAGVIKKITIKFYYPTTNENSACIKFVSARDETVYPADYWQTVEFYKSGSYTNDKYQYVSFRGITNNNFAGSGTGNDDVIYIASISAEFDSHAVLDTESIKEVDYALFNKAYNFANNDFPMVYSISSIDDVTPRVIGNKAIVLSCNTNESLSNISTRNTSIRIDRIDIYSTKACSTASTFSIGNKTISIPSLNANSWRFVTLSEPVYLNGNYTILFTSTVSANLTMRLFATE